MGRGGRTLLRYGLPGTDAVRADLITVGLLSPDEKAPPPSDPAVSPGSEIGSLAGIFQDAGQQAVLVALARAGRPELAVQNLAGLVTALAEQGGTDASNDRASAPGPAAEMLTALQVDAAFRGRLIGLLGASEPLGEHLVAHPGTWRLIATAAPFEDLLGAERCRAAVSAAARDDDGGPLPVNDAIAPLRAAYRTLLAVIAAVDVAESVEPGQIRPGLATVCEALTTAADALLAAALELAEAHHPSTAGPIRLAVIAMGKCGARELNYLSDVDVLFVAERGDDGEPVLPGSVLHDSDSAMLRVATARATEMMQICHRVAWEVDAGLRPEGHAGPLVRTPESYAAYYERWAKTWEFQALVKARPAAGDMELGARFIAHRGQQVWAAADRDSFVPDVQAMRRRVRDAVPVQDRPRELKLGSGGLRDVEFAVQLLQLVHGRSDETLHVASTLEALAALTAGGYVARADGAELAESYEFARRVEHRVQLQHLLRTHSLPSDPADLEWLARTEGFFAARQPAGQRLMTQVAKRAAVVRRLHEKLFYRPLLTAVAAVPTDELRLTPEAATKRLAALGFAAPKPALAHIAALTDGVSRRAAIQRTLLPVLLSIFADAPDPDAGLLGYRRVSDALAQTPWYLRLLRDEGLVAHRLGQLLGTSRMVPNLLQRAPEVLRLLAHDADLVGHDGSGQSAAAASGLLARASRATTAAGAVTAARSARRHELLRLVCADLLGLVDTSDVIDGLTSIADAVVLAALQAAHRQVDEQHNVAGRRAKDGDVPAGPDSGGGLSARVSVIAMGRFGGSEMAYSSDADVLFVAEPAHAGVDPDQMLADARAIAELTTQLLNKPSPDPILRIDAGLRPEGRAGPLVRTVNTYQQYWQRNVQPWDRQALLRARAIDGGEVAGAFLDVIDPIRYPAGGLSDADAREIRRIKARVDAERLPHGADPTLHTKLGRGGLADIEWTVQLLQLQHAAQLPELQQTATIATIHAAVAADLMSSDDGQALIEAWTTATRARNAIMMVTGKPDDEIPSHGTALAGVARACGYGADTDPGEFVDDYRRAARRARRVVDELFDRD